MFTPDIDKVTLITTGLQSRKIEYCEPYMGNFPASVEVFQRVVFFTGYPAGFRESWNDIGIPTDRKWVLAQFTDLLPDPDQDFRITPSGTFMGRLKFTERVGRNSSRNVTIVDIPDRKLQEAARSSGFNGKILETGSSPAKRLIEIYPCPSVDLMLLLAHYEERFIKGTSPFNFWIDMVLRNPLGDTKINSEVLPKMEDVDLNALTTTASQRALFLYNPTLLSEEIRQRITQV